MAGLSLVTSLARMKDQEGADFYEGLVEDEKQVFDHAWHLWARPEQRPPPGDWPVWLIMAGRGFGKTRAGAEWVRAIAEGDGSARFALVAANYAEARMVMVEGESGLLSIAPPARRPRWEPSLKRLRWPNGAEAQVYSAQEPEGLRGPQHSHAWCDEIAKWMNNAGQAEAAWDNLKMGLRLGRDPRITATTTPRPVALVRRLVSDGKVAVSRGSTIDNMARGLSFGYRVKRAAGAFPRELLDLDVAEISLVTAPMQALARVHLVQPF